MVPITERPRPGRRARERQLEKRGKAPLCRVGRSDEPAPSRWNRCTSDASGFLLQRHAHHTASRFSYGETLAQTSLRTITRKAGNSNSVKDLTAFSGKTVNVPGSRLDVARVTALPCVTANRRAQVPGRARVRVQRHGSLPDR